RRWECRPSPDRRENSRRSRRLSLASANPIIGTVCRYLQPLRLESKNAIWRVNAFLVVAAEGGTQEPLRLRVSAQSELTGRHTLADGIDLRDIQSRGRTRGAVARTIYKICPNVLWSEAERAGVFRGAPGDARDGFIHFSSATQVRETATRYFAGA